MPHLKSFSETKTSSGELTEEQKARIERKLSSPESVEGLFNRSHERYNARNGYTDKNEIEFAEFPLRKPLK